MVFVYKMKSRSSDNIFYAKLFIQLFKTRKSLDDLYFFILTKKTNSFLQLNCRYSTANNFSQVVPWPIQDYRRTYSHWWPNVKLQKFPIW